VLVCRKTPISISIFEIDNILNHISLHQKNNRLQTVNCTAAMRAWDMAYERFRPAEASNEDLYLLIARSPRRRACRGTGPTSSEDEESLDGCTALPS